jgi:hypothetical protein
MHRASQGAKSMQARQFPWVQAIFVLPGPVKRVLNKSGEHVGDYKAQMRIALATQ